MEGKYTAEKGEMESAIPLRTQQKVETHLMRLYLYRVSTQKSKPLISVIKVL